MTLNSHSDRSTTKTSGLRRLPFSSSRPILSSLLVVTNIGASLDCSPRSPLWLRVPSLLAYSLHSRPVYPVPRCARLVGCTLALRVVSRAFPLPLASPVYSLARLTSLVWWLTVVPFPYSFHIDPLLCPTNLTHALSSTFSGDECDDMDKPVESIPRSGLGDGESSSEPEGVRGSARCWREKVLDEAI